tara:strand:+ start:416 stop:562 length:147 start_codon:yes stop_codon:yes gene_type:complete
METGFFFIFGDPVKKYPKFRIIFFQTTQLHSILGIGKIIDTSLQAKEY